MSVMFRMACLCLALWLLAPARGWAETLVIGVAPHTSARYILQIYQPLRDALSADLGVSVEIATAPDFSEFARRALAQSYDIAITTGHQANMLRTDAGYLPLMTYRAEFRAVAVVPVHSPIKTVKDLENTTPLGLGATSLVTLWGKHWLADNNIHVQPMRYVSAADSLGQVLLAGEAPVGFMSTANFQAVAPEVRSQLKFLAVGQPLLGRVYMLNNRQAARREVMMKSLYKYGQSAAGQAYFKDTKLDGYRYVTVAELEAMEPFSEEVRRELDKASGK